MDGAGFQEISDIDVAIEGLAQPQEFFHLLGECEELTTFPLHIVNLEEIPARIDQAVAILEEMSARIDHFEAETLPVLGRTSDAVLIPVQLIENGYTAVETLFVRISQAFENNLDQHRWHSHLLEKMTLEITGVRPRVISDQLYRNLAELMRFRGW